MNKILIIVILGCITVGMYFALTFSRPDLVQSFSCSKMYTVIREYFSDRSNDKNKKKSDQNKEYSFSEAQVIDAKNKILEAHKFKNSSVIKSDQIDSKSVPDSYLYEIEFLSGRTVSANNVSTVGDVVTFANSSGLVTSVSNSEVKTVRRLAINFNCTGKVRCSEMSSCEEAKFYLRNCPGVKMDGDGDGVPCEDQWCAK